MARPNVIKRNKRGLFYAMIPGGFVLLVIVLLIMGWWEEDVTPESRGVVEDAVRAPDE